MSDEIVQHFADVRVLSSKPMALATEIYDRHGEKIGELADERRYYTPTRDLPNHVRDAFLCAEDRHFFEHHGVHWQSIVRATLKNILRGQVVQGASTISQQLVRLHFLPREKTFSRKMKEIILALVLEKHHSKETILDLYLNQIYLGNRSYGIEAAARNYFRKSAHDLTVGEAALLAGIPKSPSRYAPHRHKKNAFKRQKWVIAQMIAAQKLTTSDADQALAQPVKIFPEPEDHWQIAPYFISAVREEVARKLDLADTGRRGLKIHTTLDGTWQVSIQKTIGRHLQQINKAREISHEDLVQAVAAMDRATMSPGDANRRKNLHPVPSLPQPAHQDKIGISLSKGADEIQGAVMILDGRTGAIRAMQGGSDFGSTQFNRSLYTSRPLDTLVIPFYMAVALEHGLTPLSTIDEDLALRISRDLAGGDLRQPPPMGNEGASHLRRKPLLYELFDHKLSDLAPLALNIGQGTVATKITKLGLRKLSPRAHHTDVDRLYGAQGSPLDVAKAYAALTQGGQWAPQYLIESITTSGGRVLYQSPSRKPTKSLFSQEISRVMRQLIISAHSGRSLLGENLPPSTGFLSAITADRQDSWAVGILDDVTCVLWMGAERGSRPLGKDAHQVQSHLIHGMHNIAAATLRGPSQTESTPSQNISHFSSKQWHLVDIVGKPGLKDPMPRPHVARRKKTPSNTRPVRERLVF